MYRLENNNTLTLKSMLLYYDKILANKVINPSSHTEDMQRMQLTRTIEKDFYGQVKAKDNSIEIDIVELIKNDPELRKKALSALLPLIT